jgi:hypothetical protein
MDDLICHDMDDLICHDMDDLKVPHSCHEYLMILYIYTVSIFSANNIAHSMQRSNIYFLWMMYKGKPSCILYCIMYIYGCNPDRISWYRYCFSAAGIKSWPLETDYIHDSSLWWQENEHLVHEEEQHASGNNEQQFVVNGRWWQNSPTISIIISFMSCGNLNFHHCHSSFLFLQRRNNIYTMRFYRGCNHKDTWYRIIYMKAFPCRGKLFRSAELYEIYHCNFQSN